MNFLPNKTKKSAKGQALVEFALVLPFLLIVLAGTIEVSRMMSLYLSLQETCRRGAMFGAMADPTLSRRPAEVAIATFEMLKKNPALRYSVHNSWVDQPPDDVITVDVNIDQDGALYTQVSVRLTMSFLLLPGRGKNNSGIIPIGSTAVIMNETQGKRRDAKAVFKSERFQIIELAKGNVQKKLKELLE